MLRSLHTKDVGPAPALDLTLGERLNVLTGDNGLGKSFVLDVAWWALTGTWVGRPVLPNGSSSSPRWSATIRSARSTRPAISGRRVNGRTGPEAEISPASRASCRVPWYQVTFTAP